MGSTSVDGTRIKAVHNKDRNFTRASLAEFIRLADAKLDNYLHRPDSGDATEATTAGSRVKNLAEKISAIRDRRTRCKEMLAEVDRAGEDQISLTDADSRAMAAHTRVSVGYNAQLAAIVENKQLGAALAMVKEHRASFAPNQRRYDPARGGPPNNLEAPGMPTKNRTQGIVGRTAAP